MAIRFFVSVVLIVGSASLCAAEKISVEGRMAARTVMVLAPLPGSQLVSGQKILVAWKLKRLSYARGTITASLREGFPGGYFGYPIAEWGPYPAKKKITMIELPQGLPEGHNYHVVLVYSRVYKRPFYRVDTVQGASASFSIVLSPAPSPSVASKAVPEVQGDF